MDMKQIGSWAFIIGILISIVAAFVTHNLVPLALLVLGLIVGLVNIRQKEAVNFLIAAIALLGANAATPWADALDLIVASLGSYVSGILANIAIFVAPAAVIVALKAIIDLASKPKK